MSQLRLKLSSIHSIRRELARFLDTLDIHFSKRKWKQVFRLMDRSQQESSNTITFDEFFFFVFPQDPDAIEAEAQRLREEQEKYAESLLYSFYLII